MINEPGPQATLYAERIAKAIKNEPNYDTGFQTDVEAEILELAIQLSINPEDININKFTYREKETLADHLRNIRSGKFTLNSLWNLITDSDFKRILLNRKYSTEP